MKIVERKQNNLLFIVLIVLLSVFISCDARDSKDPDDPDIEKTAAEIAAEKLEELAPSLDSTKTELDNLYTPITNEDGSKTYAVPVDDEVISGTQSVTVKENSNGSTVVTKECKDVVTKEDRGDGEIETVTTNSTEAITYDAEGKISIKSTFTEKVEVDGDEYTIEIVFNLVIDGDNVTGTVTVDGEVYDSFEEYIEEELMETTSGSSEVDKPQCDPGAAVKDAFIEIYEDNSDDITSWIEGEVSSELQISKPEYTLTIDSADSISINFNSYNINVAISADENYNYVIKTPEGAEPSLVTKGPAGETLILSGTIAVDDNETTFDNNLYIPFSELGIESQEM